jgi:hypothetical protein
LVWKSNSKVQVLCFWTFSIILSVSKHLKTETECSLQKIVFWKINKTVFLDKDRMMENVQKYNICTNVPLSQTFRSYQILSLQ